MESVRVELGEDALTKSAGSDGEWHSQEFVKSLEQDDSGWKSAVAVSVHASCLAARLRGDPGHQPS